MFHPSDRLYRFLWTCPIRSMSLFRMTPWTWTQHSRRGLTRAEGENPLPQSAGHSAFGAVQDVSGFLACKHTLTAHVQLPVHQHHQVLFPRAALNPSLAQPLFVLGIALVQCRTSFLVLLDFTSFMWPTSQASQEPFRWHPFPPACRPHHTAECHH